MTLRSRLFRGSAELQKCAVSDPAHLVPGSSGGHVRLVQTALVYLGSKEITGAEYMKGEYGTTTASAVLKYKTERQIINRAYQSKPDNIVGKMTIARMDSDLRLFEILPPPSQR